MSILFINVGPNNTLCFKNVAVGAVFRFKNRFYIKTLPKNACNALCLDGLELTSFDEIDSIMPVSKADLNIQL